MIPGNPYSTRALDAVIDHDDVTQALLVLAYEQHQRNRLAAITAQNRAISLPPDLQALTTEGTPS